MEQGGGWEDAEAVISSEVTDSPQADVSHRRTFLARHFYFKILLHL